MMAEMGRFDWEDPFGLDAQLTDEERMVRDTARDYAQGELLPRVTSAFLEERFDREIMSEMGALGLLGPTIPKPMAARAWAMSPMAWSRAKSSASIRAIARR
jgi:glutaryl-CoA dehydrogenase